MSINNPFASDIAVAAEKTDHTKAKESTRTVPDAGTGFCRLIGYIELGKQPDEYQGKPKAPSIEVVLVFELLSKKWMHPGDDGKDHGLLHYERVRLHQNSKAKFTKLFNLLRGGRQNITHFAQMLGEAFKVTILHREVAAQGDKPARVFANVTKEDGSYSFGSAMTFDPETEQEIPVSVAAPTYPLMLLLWNAPTKQQWDSIFIDGQYETKEKDADGKPVMRSRNRFQEQALAAVDFDGSPLQMLLAGAGEALAAPPKHTPAPDTGTKAPAGTKAAPGNGGKKKPASTKSDDTPSSATTGSTGAASDTAGGEDEFWEQYSGGNRDDDDEAPF